MKVTVELPRPMEADVTIRHRQPSCPNDLELKISPQFFGKSAKAQLLYLTIQSEQGQDELRYMLEVSGVTGKLNLTPISPVTCAFDESPPANPDSNSQERTATTTT